MHNIEQLQQRIDKTITEAQLSGHPQELYEPINYVLALGGKRVRPLLLLMANDLFGGNIEEGLLPALGIEVFHNFTLLHDDIMDKAPLRRGKATVHEKWNANIAILSGDTMFVKACQLMMQVPQNNLSAVLEIFFKTAVEVCEGQQLDMNFEQCKDVTIAQYEHMIELKTAVLLAASLKIGAVIACAPDKDANLLAEFGRCMGIAFQLQDDILDVFGQADKFGKQVGGDILADKKTYLLLKALETEACSGTDELHDIIHGSKRLEENAKVLAVTAIYNKLGVKQLAETEMQQWFEQAMEALNKININEERKLPLKTLAGQLLRRDI